MASVHASAHRLEHVTDPAMQAELDRAAGHPVRDPHDKKIPD
jgi:manganese/zinc/iron transport system permease protein